MNGPTAKCMACGAISPMEIGYAEMSSLRHDCQSSAAAWYMEGASRPVTIDREVLALDRSRIFWHAYTLGLIAARNWTRLWQRRKLDRLVMESDRKRQRADGDYYERT